MTDPSTREKKIVVNELKKGPQESAHSGGETDTAKKQESQPLSGIKWTEVLGISPTEQVRSRLEAPQKREIPQQLVNISKQNVLEALMITVNAGKVGRQLENNPLLSVREAISAIDSSIDFRDSQNIDPQKVAAAIEKLFQTNPSQAIALGLVIQEYKLSLLRKHYRIQFEQVEAGKKSQGATEPRRVGEMTIDPKTSELNFNERPMSYEEFIQTPEGHKIRKFLGKEWRSTVSRKEFERMFGSEEGKPGNYKLVISKNEQQTGKAAEQTPQKQLTPEEFILQQLDLLDLDPQNLTDFRWLWQEVQLTTLMRTEVIRATGGDPLKISNLLDKNLQLPEIFKEAQIGEAAQRVTKALEEARTAQAEKTRQELEASRQQQAEKSFRSQLEQRKREIEEILEKRREEGKKRTGQESTTELTSNGIIDNTVGELIRRGFQIPEGIDLKSLAGIEGGEGMSLEVMKAKAKGLRAQIEVYKPNLSRVQQLEEKLAQLAIEVATTPDVRVIRTKDGEEKEEKISDQRREKGIEIINQRIEALYPKKVREIESELAKLEDEIAFITEMMKLELTMNGQRKTVEGWLEEARKIENQKGEESKQEGKSPYEQMLVPQLETELSKINVVLGYFDEQSLTARSERATRMSAAFDEDLQSFHDLKQIQSLNPELYQILKKVFFEPQKPDRRKITRIERSRKKLLFVLEQAFGNDFIFPPDQSSQAYKDIIAFLGSVDLKSVKNLKDFDDLMKRVRMEVNNPQLRTNNNRNNLSQSSVNPQIS